MNSMNTDQFQCKEQQNQGKHRTQKSNTAEHAHIVLTLPRAQRVLHPLPVSQLQRGDDLVRYALALGADASEHNQNFSLREDRPSHL